MPLSPDFINDLRKVFAGEIRTDLTTRILYSTDASIYQIEPLGVAFPRTQSDLAAAMEVAAAHGVPVLPRGSGSSLAGQAVGQALILDCTQFLNRIVEINPERMTATVEPGVILAALNRTAAAHGLQFGPDPASAERATIGGSLANNAAGAHSILYGMAADHLVSAEVVLSDGSQATFEEISLERARQIAAGDRRDVQTAIYRAALDIRERYGDAIRQHWPKTWRRASGYNLNYLLPWSPSQPPLWDENNAWQSESGPAPIPYPPVSPGCINLAPLLAGSEGTLAVIRQATLRLVPNPRYTVLGVMAFSGLAEACEATPAILELKPSAVELIPQALIHLARSVPAYAHQLSFVEQLSPGGEPAALLVVEFSGDNPAVLREQVRRLGPGVFMAGTAQAQKQVWAVRKVGLGILMSRPGDLKPIAFIEDLAVPVERLGEFVRSMEQILARNGTQGNFYAHASAGCLHIRPLINLKAQGGVSDLRRIATEAVELTLQLGGAVSGEHGDGIARR